MKLNNVSLFLSKQYEEKPFNYINAHGVLKENRRIINMQIELNNDNPPNIDIFIFPEHNKNTEISINNEISNTKRIIMGNISNNEYDLSEDEENKIKQNIREIITRIYLSEASILEEDKKNVLEYMNTQFGRDYFASILNTGNINNRDIKLVSEESYEFFNYTIFNTFLNILKLGENENNLYCIIKLLKASLCIKTKKNKKEYLLCDDLFYKLEKYSPFNSNLFWKMWIEDEMTQNDMKILKLTEFSNEIKESEEYGLYLRHSFEILEGLTSIMLKLKIDNSKIINTISELGKEYIINEKDYQKLVSGVLNEIKYFQK